MASFDLVLPLPIPKTFRIASFYEDCETEEEKWNLNIDINPPIEPFIPGIYDFICSDNFHEYYKNLGYGAVKCNYNNCAYMDLTVTYDNDTELWNFDFNYRIRHYILEFKMNDQDAREGDRTMDNRPCKTFATIAHDNIFVIKQKIETEDGRDVEMIFRNTGRRGMTLVVVCDGVSADVFYKPCRQPEPALPVEPANQPQEQN